MTGEKKWHGTESYLIMLIEVVMSSDERLIEEALRYFLGRGKGLTPSGDDMIVGILAFDAVFSISFHTLLTKYQN